MHQVIYLLISRFHDIILINECGCRLMYEIERTDRTDFRT